MAMERYRYKPKEVLRLVGEAHPKAGVEGRHPSRGICNMVNCADGRGTEVLVGVMKLHLWNHHRLKGVRSDLAGIDDAIDVSDGKQNGDGVGVAGDTK